MTGPLATLIPIVVATAAVPYYLYGVRFVTKLLGETNVD